MGGDTATMQSINTEYSFACAKLISGENLSCEETEAAILELEAYKNAISAIAGLQGIFIEAVGSWIWVSGNTYPVKNQIKEAGFMFASSKKMWYFRTEENASCNRKKMDIEQIRSKYGSQSVNTNNYSKRAIA